MADLGKVIRGWERCRKCHDVPMLFSESYRDCEYTRGMYCRQDILIEDTLALLKEKDCNCCGTVFDVAYKAGKADAVVRCKDCKHYRATPGYCAYDRIWQENKGHIWGMYCKPDWFCADGERRDDDA